MVMFSSIEKRVDEFQPGRKAQGKGLERNWPHNTGSKDNLAQIQSSCLVSAGC